MELSILSKQQLLENCTNLGITKCKSKSKNELIKLIEGKTQTPTKNIGENDLNGSITNNIDEPNFLQKFNKCDIFTPDNISQLMSSKLNAYGTILEPSVGTGQLLKYIDFNNYDKIDIFEIKQEYIDVIPNCSNLNKFVCDFLEYEFTDKYTNIILNPPYIKIQNLPATYIADLKTKWPLFRSGNIDLYYIFLVKCLNLLADDGVMVAITPNSYLHNKSALKFRKYLFENTFIQEIIDYKDKKVFDNAAVYCCITIFTKQKKEVLIYNGQNINYNLICNKSNNLYLLHYSNNITTQICDQISKKLCDICRIYNGIATLRDGIYIHDEKLFDEPCWQIIKTSTKYKYCIYPYDDNGVIIDEQTFKTTNVNTYNYLLSVKDELNKRDNGNITYPKWYSYGRTQSLIISKKEKVIYLPTFINPNNIHFAVENPTLHMSCLCIEPNDVNNIDFIINTIQNNIEYIKKNSSVKNNGWINISSTILKSISI